jgi:Na+/H+-dicarboxylate symporter
MYDRTGNYLIVAILIGMVLGVVVVALLGEAALSVKFLGDMFLNALRMVVIPLLFCSMIVGITGLGDIRKLGRTGFKTILYFLATSSIAVAIGLILVNIFQPGIGVSIGGAAEPAVASYSFFDWLIAQIPSNLIAAAAETKVLPIIIFALFFGGVLTTIGSKGKPVIAFFEGLNEAIMKLVHIIMWFAPIGIFGLVAGQLALQGGLSEFSSVLSGLGKYALVVILGLLLHGVLVLPSILKFMGGKNPIEYLIGMSQALMTALATASSSATLPVTIECVEEKNDIDRRSSSFVLPLGATINMDGTALYESVAAIFIAQAYGIDLSILQQMTIFATAILASIGAAGIPEAGLVTMVLVLQAVGLPLEGIGLILAIDWFLDRCRTTVNVWGDSIGAAVIATTAEIGLVDRHRLKAAGPERTTRMKKPTRREKTREKYRTPAAPHKTVKERATSRAGKSGGIMSRIMRREASSQKERTPRFEKRAVLKDRTGSEFRASDRREEYRPAGPEQAAKKPDKYQQRPVGGKQDETKASLQTTEKRPERPARSKPTYGRKPFHGRPGRSLPREGEKRRPEREPTKTPGLTNQSADKNESGTFIVPKFPKKILEELTDSNGGQESITPDLANADTGSPFRREEKEKQPTPAASLPVEKDKDLSPAEKPGHPPEDIFSRLDEMVLGDSLPSKAEEGTESPVPETETPDSEEKTERAPLSSEADDTRESASESTTEGSHDRQATQESPDDGRDARDESDITDDADSGESKPDDGDIQKKWGRPKRKKISR